MIDAVHVEIDNKLLSRTSYNTIRNKLLRHEKLWPGYDPNVHVGKLKHMRVKCLNECLKVEGSIPKEIFGNNLEIPSYSEIFDFFTRVYHDYGIPIHLGNFTQIEFGFNFFMDHPVKNYLNCLLETPGYSFSRFKGSVYYHRDNYKLRFYDKGREIRKKFAGDPSFFGFPPEVLNANILRYEIVFHSRLYQFFDFGSLKPVLIHSQKFREVLAKHWSRAYWSIEKHKLLAFDNSLDTLPKLKTQVWLKGIHGFGGLNRIIELYKDMKEVWPDQP